MILTEKDLIEIARSTVEMVLESVMTVGSVYRPYRIGVAFRDHAFVQSHGRKITWQDVVDEMSLVSERFVSDYENGVVKVRNNEPGSPVNEVFKVVDRDSCLVSVFYAEPTYDMRRIYKYVVITVYVWDGKMNYDNSRGEKIYYVNEPSEAFIEATEWNREHQDLVGEYTRHMHDIDTKRQREAAKRAYDALTGPFATDDVPSERRFERERMSFKRKRLDDMDKIYDEMRPEDLEAARMYGLKMDYMPMASKGSANRDLVAADVLRQRRYYGDKANGMSYEELLKLPKAVGKINLSDEDLKKDRINVKRKTSDETKNYRRKDKGYSR
jgi:hypothetical protein